MSDDDTGIYLMKINVDVWLGYPPFLLIVWLKEKDASMIWCVKKAGQYYI